MSSLGRVICAGFGALVALACLDMSPLDYHPEGASDAGSDAAVDGAWKVSCGECIVDEPTCQFAACAADARCSGIQACVLDLGCLLPRDLNVRIACAKPCFDRFGVQDVITDPSVLLYYPVAGCTTSPAPCGSVCEGL